jgi:Uma2 family endonuclease
MFTYEPWACLPSSEELPDSDDKPVDNELQDLIPGLLKAVLAWIWRDRWDWFFGVDMGIYYDPDQPAIVPDGFLSLGVPRAIDEDLRLSYVLWEERKIPTLVLEVVSKKYRGEYGKKKLFYQEMGVQYYAVYSSRRKKKPPLEVYELVNDTYQLMSGNPVWLPEVGLALGRERIKYQGIEREWLYWYDQAGNRFLTADERAEQEQFRAEQERFRAEQERFRAEQAEQQLQDVVRQLQQRGIDPASLGL